MPAGGKVYHGHKTRNGMTKIYRTWLGMKRRCYDQKCKGYATWGGRGIEVCDRWNTSFITFLADMGEPPTDKHTLDRLDSNGNYEPGNCRWATMQQQGGENRRGLKPITVNGIEFSSTSKAAQYFGIGHTTVLFRLNAGMSADDAFHKPHSKRSRRSRESYLPRNHPDRKGE